MVEFSKREELQRWLEDKPHEWAVVIAARATLRVLPMLATALDPHDRGIATVRRAIVLSTFRAMAASWVAGMWHNHADKASDFSDAAKAANGAYTELVYISNSMPATNAAYAAHIAAEVAKQYVATPWHLASLACTSVSYSASAAVSSADIWVSVSSDANALEAAEPIGLRPADLAIQALWANSAPTWATTYWLMLKQAIQETNEGWEVWTDWYEARMSGASAGLPVEALEVARLRIAEKIWARGPKVVNAHIKKLIEQYTPQRVEGVITTNLMRLAALDGDEPKLLSQRPAAFRFAVQAARIEATPQQEMPPDAALASDIYSELKSKISDLVDQLQQSNSARRVVQTAQRLLDCLGANLGDVKPGILLMRHRSLEADAAAYDTAEGRQELFPDAIAMMRDLIASTDDLMGVYVSIRNIQAAALALELQRSDVDAVQANLEEIRLAAAQSEIVASSARNALATALPDVEEITRTIETAHDDLVRAAAIDKRAQIVSLQVLDYRNFVSAVIQPLASAGRGLSRVGSEVSKVAGKSLQEAADAVPRGVGRGVEESVKGLIKGGIATLVGSIFGPVAGLAVLVASLRPLARKTEEVKGALENKPAPEADGKNVSQEHIES